MCEYGKMTKIKQILFVVISSVRQRIYAISHRTQNFPARFEFSSAFAFRQIEKKAKANIEK